MSAAAITGVQRKFASKGALFRHVEQLWKQGKLYDLNDPHPRIKGVFAGSADRYCEIAFLLQDFDKVLDVGSGSGLLLSILANLGHQCWALDLRDLHDLPSTYKRGPVTYATCNVEVDPYPFPDAFFDAVTCCQVMEHFSHSPLSALAEMKRILRPGGRLEIDVPNVASFRNRMRIIRGKNITWDYREHYVHAKPLFHKGHSFYPFRHNREFTKAELHDLLSECGFLDVNVRFLEDRNYRTSLKRFLSVGTGVRNLIPSWRKSLIAHATKG